LYSGLLAGLLGLVAGVFDYVASKSAVFANVNSFLSALFVALLSRLLAFYLPPRLGLCFFSMTLGSLVWLLPGLSITVGVSELTSGAKVGLAFVWRGRRSLLIWLKLLAYRFLVSRTGWFVSMVGGETGARPA
jgi:uncharacterized membrane protein YjjP (DUF1212 family)